MWKRIRPGFYQADIDGVRFTIERVAMEDLAERKVQWNCYSDGVIFDAGATLAEAKSYCREEQTLNEEVNAIAARVQAANASNL